MSSFTPYYDPSLSLFQASFFPWIALESWNSNSMILYSMKNKQVTEQTFSPFIVQDQKATLPTQYGSNQEEYEPESKNQGYELQERKKGGRIQCKGRNDYSNILKAFIHLIKTQDAVKNKIKGIIVAKNLPLTYERFLLRIRRKFSKGKTYISPKQILTFMKTCISSQDESEKAISLVFKIILRNFLSVEYILCLIKGFKGKKQSRKDLIVRTRQLYRIIFEDGFDLESN